MIEIAPWIFEFHSIRAQQVLRAPLCYAIDPTVDLSDARCFKSADGLAGFAIKPDGELVNMHSFAKGRGTALIEAAIARGARRLNVFAGPVADRYLACGFREIERYTFSDALAPPGWIAFWWGRPDVIVMELA